MGVSLVGDCPGQQPGFKQLNALAEASIVIDFCGHFS
jgi:hypothetical protein